MSDNLQAALSLIENSREGALATLDAQDAPAQSRDPVFSRPFVSAVGYLYERTAGKYGTTYLLLSDLARHTVNLKKNPGSSLLIVEANQDLPIHERKRVTLLGKAKIIDDKKKFEALKKDYLKIYPRAEIFFTLPDFRFYEIEINEIYWIGGFGKAEHFR